MQNTPDADRLGTAIALLSLDRIVPYYSAMGLMPSQEHAEAVKTCVRDAIAANRADFLANPKTTPDLGAHVTAAFEGRFGVPGRAALFRWYEQDFVHTAADRVAGYAWYALLDSSWRDHARWSALALPEGISERARRDFGTASDLGDIEKIEDGLMAEPRSGWDAHMYLIHGFDDDDEDAGMCPFMWVRETVENHRFRQFLRRLEAGLSESERRSFWTRANALKETISSTRKLPPLRYPFDDLR